MKKLALAAAALVLATILVATRWEGWLIAALDPGIPFDPTRAPPAPEYEVLASWTAHPELEDPSDVAPVGLRATDPAAALADAFYVHPTSYLGPGWNGPVDDPELNAQTDELATLIQASAFNECCAVYGPRYRQAHGQAFLQPGPDAEAAIALAYADVRDAFRLFLERHSRGRPFVLVGHSQGAALGARLLREEIAGQPAAEQLVAAYLIGGPVNADPSGFAACSGARDTGCLVAWNARGPRFEGSVLDFQRAGERLCVNPLTWRHDDAPGDARLNEGAVFLHAGDGAPLPGFADARCRDGVLQVSQIGDPPRDFMSTLLDFIVGPENYHPIEIQLYYMNLRRNAAERVEAFVRGAAPRAGRSG